MERLSSLFIQCNTNSKYLALHIVKLAFQIMEALGQLHEENIMYGGTVVHLTIRIIRGY